MSDKVELKQLKAKKRFRRPSKEDIFGFLMDARTLITRSDVPLIPLMCPKCDSFRITVVMGTDRLLECMDCGSKFRIVDGWEHERKG